MSSTIADLADLVLRTSWQAGFFFLLIAVLLFACGERIAPRWRFVIWSLVLVRLLLVVTPESPVSLFNLFAPARVADVAIDVDIKSEKAHPVVVDASAIEPVLQSDATEAVAGKQVSDHAVPIVQQAHVPSEMATLQVSWSLGLFLVWLTGFAAFVTLALLDWFRLRRRLAACSPNESSHLSDLISKTSTQLGCNRTPELLISRQDHSPFVTGVWKPRLIIPEVAVSEMSDVEMECLFTHEIAHIRRGDVAVQWLVLFVKILYWFHPAAWLADWRMQICRESACDDIAVDRLGAEAYGNTLLRMSSYWRHKTSVDFAPGCCGWIRRANRGDRKPIQARIRRIAMPTQNRAGWHLAAASLVAAFAVLTFTDQVARVAIGQERSSDLAPALAKNAVVPDDSKAEFFIGGRCAEWASNDVIDGVQLTLYEVIGISKKKRKIDQTVSDENGAYRFDSLLPPSSNRFAFRNYLIVARKAGHPSVVIQHVSVSRRDRHHIMMHTGVGSASGQVVDSSGNPIAGAIVQRGHVLVDAREIDEPVFVTKEDGAFVLTGVPAFREIREDQRGPAPVVVGSVTHPDYFPVRFTEKKRGFKRVTMKKNTLCRVRGRLIDDRTGQPLNGVFIRAQPKLSDHGRPEDVQTNLNGEFEFRLQSGVYHLLCDVENLDLVTKAVEVECRDDQVRHVGTIKAVQGGWIVGRILDSVTNQPVIKTQVEGIFLPIDLGVVGPSRPVAQVGYSYGIANVKADGSFKLPAFPGENQPYVLNLYGVQRTFWTRKRFDPVIVESGKETVCNIIYERPLTGDEKIKQAQEVIDALPEDQEKRIGAILQKLESLPFKMNRNETWCCLIRELHSIGKPAVLPLCEKLKQTDNPWLRRQLPFALRAIGDPRAVPTLIQTLPKTLNPPGNDYGLEVSDFELMEFMLEHDNNERRSTTFSYGRPVRESLSAIKVLTAAPVNTDRIAQLSRSSDPHVLAEQRLIYRRATERWAKWWQQNWESTGVDKSFSKVELQTFVPTDTSGVPTGLNLTKDAKVDLSTRGWSLAPVGHGKRVDCFVDLDLMLEPKWPNSIPRRDGSQEVLKQAWDYATSKKADLMCVTKKYGQDKSVCAFLAVGMKVWELDPIDAGNLKAFLERGELPTGRELKHPYLLHYDARTGRSYPKVGSSFLCLTREHGLGVLTVRSIGFSEKANSKDPFGDAPPLGVASYEYVRIAR